MIRRRITRGIPFGLGFLVAAVAGIGFSGASAGAQTASDALIGEGGSFLTPVTNLLLQSDTGLAPLYPSYADSSIDNAIADFTGTAPGDFAADFVVTERPFTSAEAADAQTNGRSYAYVPFAATPVAIAVFAICNESNFVLGITNPSPFCPGLPLTPTQVGEIFTTGYLDPSEAGGSSLPTPPASWSDFTQSDGQPVPDTDAITLASTLSPSAENSTLMALMDSDPTAKGLLDNALDNPNITPSTTSDTPNEIWPFQGDHSWIGGDEGLLGKELNIEASTDAPDYLDTWAALNPGNGNGHDAFPVSAVWTGSPEGTPWNVPTAAVENADVTGCPPAGGTGTGSPCFVVPTWQAAQAAESGDGITLDPTTNLVTFSAQPSNAAAYNNYLMAESYLVVPTNGLPAEKATKLAQLIRYILGPSGQSEEELLGAAPDTAAEVSAGLKVADELDTEAITSAGATATGNTTTAGSSSPGSGSSSEGSDGASSGAELAFTGGDPVPMVLVGALLTGVATVSRRRLRHRARGRGIPCQGTPP